MLPEDETLLTPDNLRTLFVAMVTGGGLATEVTGSLRLVTCADSFSYVAMGMCTTPDDCFLVVLAGKISFVVKC